MMTQPPMFGQAQARVLQSQAVSIHGDMYHDIIVLCDEPDQPPPPMPGPNEPITPLRLRVPQHLLSKPPAQGDLLMLDFLMSQVQEARFL